MLKLPQPALSSCDPDCPNASVTSARGRAWGAGNHAFSLEFMKKYTTISSMQLIYRGHVTCNVPLGRLSTEGLDASRHQAVRYAISPPNFWALLRGVFLRESLHPSSLSGRHPLIG